MFKTQQLHISFFSRCW